MDDKANGVEGGEVSKSSGESWSASISPRDNGRELPMTVQAQR